VIRKITSDALSARRGVTMHVSAKKKGIGVDHDRDHSLEIEEETGEGVDLEIEIIEAPGIEDGGLQVNQEVWREEEIEEIGIEIMTEEIVVEMIEEIAKEMIEEIATGIDITIMIENDPQKEIIDMKKIEIEMTKRLIQIGKEHPQFQEMKTNDQEMTQNDPERIRMKNVLPQETTMKLKMDIFQLIPRRWTSQDNKKLTITSEN
jgi:hypothetical protein